jgi:hypothetical protein
VLCVRGIRRYILTLGVVVFGTSGSVSTLQIELTASSERLFASGLRKESSAVPLVSSEAASVTSPVRLSEWCQADFADETNATRAYAVLGFSWGMGGVLGPVGCIRSIADIRSSEVFLRAPL